MFLFFLSYCKQQQTVQEVVDKCCVYEPVKDDCSVICIEIYLVFFFFYLSEKISLAISCNLPAEHEICQVCFL